MIIVKLQGGLGNQLFQYAAARRLAHRHNAALKLDTSFLKVARVSREYELGHFNISAVIASNEEIKEIVGYDITGPRPIIERLRSKLGFAGRVSPVYKQPHFHFDPALLNAPDNIYLDGYWQSEKYFRDIEGIIRRELVVRHPLEGKNLEITELIQTVDSVSFHVRRGDYVTDPEANRVHGNVCGPDYWRRSMDEVAAWVARPHFFVFSDDPGWVKENLEFNHPVTFVAHNGPEKACEDLRLMSLCRHQIIANSSFSWWGAWLNGNPDKIVIAPDRWLNRQDVNEGDIIPATWRRL